MRQSLAKYTLRPKTVAEYTDVMNDVADIFVNRLRFLREKDGDVENLHSELQKWALECKYHTFKPITIVDIVVQVVRLIYHMRP